MKPSCSRVVYDYFSETKELPSYFLKAVEEADIIDSFSYASIEEWRKETPGKMMDWTLKAHFPSTEDHFAYMRNLVQQLRDRPIEEVSNLPFVQKRLKQYREEEGRMIKVIQDSSSFLEQDQRKEIIVIDLTPYQRRPHLIKNLAFLIYPESLAVLEIYSLLDQGVKSNHLGVLHVPFDQGEPADGKQEYRRDHEDLEHRGRPSRGSCRNDSLQIETGDVEKKKEILNQIFKLWSAQ